MNKAPNYYRQGDVLLVRVVSAPESEPTKHTEYTVQHGEATGHHHTLYPSVDGVGTAPTLDLFSTGSSRFIELDTQWLLKHQEHTALQIEPGVYEIIIEEEYDPFTRVIHEVID